MSEAKALRIQIVGGIEAATPEIRAGLRWFDLQVDKEIPWPRPCPVPELEHVVTTSKGIYKPRIGLNPLEVALSIRNNLDGPYRDELRTDLNTGIWNLRYRFEGADRTKYTNLALQRNQRLGIPVGVLIQTQREPSRYLVKGLAIVLATGEGVFDLQGVTEAR